MYLSSLLQKLLNLQYFCVPLLFQTHLNGLGMVPKASQT